MKSLNLLKSSVLLLGLPFILNSCTKVDDEPGNYNTFQVGTETPIDLNLGIIFDNGLAKSGVKKMNALFVDQGYIVDAATGVATGKGSEISINFYTAGDGMIPSGDYIFSEEKSMDPFTFDSAFVTEFYSFETGEGHIHDITGGTVTVVYDGSEYEFTFNLNLITGSNLVGTFKGTMDYYDDYR